VGLEGAADRNQGEPVAGQGVADLVQGPGQQLRVIQAVQLQPAEDVRLLENRVRCRRIRQYDQFPVLVQLGLQGGHGLRQARLFAGCHDSQQQQGGALLPAGQHALGKELGVDFLDGLAIHPATVVGPLLVMQVHPVHFRTRQFEVAGEGFGGGPENTGDGGDVLERVLLADAQPHVLVADGRIAFVEKS